MDDRELEILLNDIESDRVERKASISDRDKICQAICAFANDLPNHRQPSVLLLVSTMTEATYTSLSPITSSSRSLTCDQMGTSCLSQR